MILAAYLKARRGVGIKAQIFTNEQFSKKWLVLIIIIARPFYFVHKKVCWLELQVTT